MATSKLIILIMILFSPIGPYGFLYLKKGSQNIMKCIKNPLRHYQLFLGLALLGFSFVFYAVMLRFAEVSVLYPLNALGYIWTTFFSIKYLREKMNRWKWAGIALIMLSVVLIGLGSG